MYAESDFVMLSALQHYVYCPRQCALIHLEQIWVESGLTAEGRLMHERADSGETSYRTGVRIARSVQLRSSVLGVSGVADVVEWHKREDGEQPFPVEYKRGKPKKHDADRIQLCAQAMCLEEMTGSNIPAGALFYGQTRHRHDVIFDQALRDKTVRAAEGVHQLFQSSKTPAAEFSPKCEECSLKEQCIPEVTCAGKSAKTYLNKLIESLEEDEI
ncbi:MAG: CRISPR-associated protein Cas4 [Chlorobiales bacterium]|nr:CRISPR-associated protein Cas4 [Chlorobiales bacterium]